MKFYDYHECELRDCLMDSLISLGYPTQVEMIKKEPFTIDLINNLIQTIIIESNKKNKPIDDRIYLLGIHN